MTRRASADVVICGAGIAGIATAYELAVRRGVTDVVVVDERPPLSLTSDKSTECYRNWWPGPGDAMVRLMDRSIDLLEELARESGNRFALNRRGYVYLTADPARAAAMERQAQEVSRLGAGPLRIHRGRPDDPPYTEPALEGFEGQPTGADLFLDGAAIRRRFPCLADDVVALLSPRRCGWLDAQQLGMYLLEESRARGVRLLRGRLEEVVVEASRVAAVRLGGAADTTLATRALVDAAGPFVGDVARLAGVELPVFNELHCKVAFTDHLGLVPRELPLVAWNDPITLTWDAEERAGLSADDELRWLLGELPPGVHFRPEGGATSRVVVMLWAYDAAPCEPRLPPPCDPLYPQVVLRGAARVVPALAAYFDKGRRPFVDGGYYCKTRENRPLVGPLPVDGFFLVGALSGFGIMAALGAAELAAAWITSGELPAYAPAFSLARYDDPAYRKLLATAAWGGGQL